jgi:hypothetical protein
MNDEFDDLDRALFALPLETPPAGMREAILRATSHMPATAFALGRYEIVAIGSFLAIFVWMLLVLLGDPTRASDFNLEVSAVVSALAQPATLLWLATGASVAACFSVGLPGIGEHRIRRS